MRIFVAVVQLALTALLSSCNQHTDIDPKLGLECYEMHRASLPPGTQYEGIKKLAEDRLTIKIMNGVEVVTLECRLNPDGTMQGNVK